MPATGAYAADVLARLRDFVSAKTHWQRRLWTVGLALELREVIEASDAVAMSVLSQEALSWLTERVRRHVAADPGAGDARERGAAIEYLKRDLAMNGLSYLVLRQITDDVSANYLARWAAELRNATALPGPERTARALAAHLLDSGLGPSTLTNWLDGFEAGHPTLDIADLCDDAQSLIDAPREHFRVLVPLAAVDANPATRPAEWIRSELAIAWLRGNGFSDLRLSQKGGLLLEIDACDEEAALSAIADTIDRFMARVVVGSASRFQFHENVYFAGGKIVRRTRPRRWVEVHALSRADAVHDLRGAGPIDSALELLAHLETAAPPVAVAAGWSAIESLLVGPGTRSNVVAGDRLASLVTCSWPRAELTDLAWGKARQKDDALCTELFRLKTNREKALRLSKELQVGNEVVLQEASDVAAAKRMSKLLADPKSVLVDVQLHVSEAFRRLYRVRNIILHGGQVSPVALNATLRSVPPLAGAGMDRLTHAYLVSGRLPLEVAARAELEIARAGSTGAPALVDILE